MTQHFLYKSIFLKWDIYFLHFYIYFSLKKKFFSVKKFFNVKLFLNNLCFLKNIFFIKKKVFFQLTLATNEQPYRISSPVTSMDSYCKNICPIVSLIIKISWLLILRISSWKKTFFLTNSTSKSPMLSGLRGTLPLLPVQRCHAYRMILCCQHSFVTDKKGRLPNFSLFWSLHINKQQNQ